MCSMLKVAIIGLCYVTLVSSISSNEDYKLPSDTRPETYQLHLHTDIHDKNFNFRAHVKIKMRILEVTESVVLHSVDLKIHNITLNYENGTLIKEDVGHTENKTTETILITNFGVDLVKNELYELIIHYDGVFPSDFIGETESEDFFLAVAFDRVKFRQICPSYDEYEIRSIYEIDIGHHNSYHAIGLEAEIEEQEENFVLTTFKATKSIPTTSIAFIVSNLELILDDQDDELKIEIYGKETAVDDFQYALEKVRDIIKTANTYFDSSHKLTSLKLIALPSNIIISPVSTFELIIVNQHQIIYRPDTITTKTTQKDKILRVLTRSIVKQYFGNVISMAEWKETFLTDGLSIYFDNFFINELENENLIDIKMSAMEIDSLPITNSLESIRKRLFNEVDEFSARKTASILQMFQSAYGEEKFIEMIKNFIENFKFEAAKIEDFYCEIDDDEFKSFLASWFENIGFPLLTIKQTNSTHYSISQERFLVYNLESNNDEELWKIPIFYQDSTENANSEIIWMNEEKIEIEDDSEWIILNHNGYYRVNYDENLWSKLINVLKDEENFKKIPTQNRAMLINDAAYLAFAEKISYETLLNLLSYLKHEDEVTVWKNADEAISFLDMMLSTHSDLYEKFKKLISDIIEPIYSKYGHDLLEDEGREARETRKIAIHWACKIGIESCVDFISDNFDKDSVEIHPDMQSIINCNGLRTADEETFDKFLDKMLLSNDNEKVDLIDALACTENHDSLVKLIVLINNTNQLSNYDKNLTLIAVTKNYKYGAKAAIELLNIYFSKLSEAEVIFMLNIMSKRMWNSEWLTTFNSKIGNLMTETKISINEGGKYKIMANITANWMIINRDEISQWFDENMKETTTLTTTTAQSTQTDETTSTESTTTDGTNVHLPSFSFFIFTFIALKMTFFDHRV